MSLIMIQYCITQFQLLDETNHRKYKQQVGSRGTASNFYSESEMFESRPEHQLSVVVFLLHSLRQNCVTASVKPRPLPLACFLLGYSILILVVGTAHSELPGSSINKNYNKRSQRNNIQSARNIL